MTPGIGPSYTYVLWVWPVKITSTFAEVCWTILAKTGEAAISSASVGVPAVELSGAPSWYSAMITSASPLAALPSVSWAATRLTASTGSPKVSVADAGRRDQARRLLRDRTDDADRDLSGWPWLSVRTSYSWQRQRHRGGAGRVDVGARGRASRRCGPAPMTSVNRSAEPWSNSWLPTAEALELERVQHVDRRLVVGDRARRTATRRCCRRPRAGGRCPPRRPQPPARSRSWWRSVVVFASMRPWKSLMFKNVNVVCPAAPADGAPSGDAVAISPAPSAARPMPAATLLGVLLTLSPSWSVELRRAAARRTSAAAPDHRTRRVSRG